MSKFPLFALALLGCTTAGGTPNDSTLDDADGDGLSDQDERDYGTDPKNADTDADGLNDLSELMTGTDPNDPDTDADTLYDGMETILGTNPILPDTDSDGYLDGWEVSAGTDPKDASSVIYLGGWPYQSAKDVLAVGAPSHDDATPTVGQQLLRTALTDAYGESVDLYDFAGHAKPIIVDVSASWSEGASSLMQWLTDGTDRGGYGYEAAYPHLRQAIANGDLYFIEVLTDVTDPALLADWTPMSQVAVLADDGSIASAYGGKYLPAPMLLDQGMVITTVPAEGDGWQPWFQALADADQLVAQP